MEIKYFEDKVTIDIPDCYTEMPEEMQIQKFPYAIRPPVIWMNTTEETILTLSLLDKDLGGTEVLPALYAMKKEINHMHPESILTQPKLIVTDHVIKGWFSYSNGSLKGDIYHAIYILPAEKKFILGSFHCPMEQMEEEHKKFLDILKSIRVISSGKDDFIIGKEVFK